MLKWNIRNQILSTGILGFLVVVIAIFNFYGFSKDQFLDSTKNLMSLSGKQYASFVADILNKQAADFKGWIQDDVYGLAIEFETTSEMQNEFIARMNGSDRFAVLVLVDEGGTVLQIAGSRELNSAASGYRGRILPDFSGLHKQNADAAVFMDSKFLSELNKDYKETYVFYHPAYSMDKKQNGAFIAYTNWPLIHKEITKCTESLADIGLKQSKVLLAFPETETAPIRETADHSEFLEEEARQLVGWSRTATNNVVSEMQIDGENNLTGITSIAPPRITASAKMATPTLILTTDESAAISQLNRMVTQIIILSLIGTLIALGASYFIARKISARISKIAHVAEEIAMGDINQDIETSSNDEIGKLAEAFKKLIDYMKNLAEAAEDIAKNDLTVRVEPRSESDVLGNSFKIMISNLTEIVGLIAGNANQLVAAAAEISLSAEEMAKGANNQTAQAGQISTAIEEMAATILESSRNANEAREIAEGASGMANEGKGIVGDTIKGMLLIADSAADSSMIVNELAQASDRIGEIIGVIDDIADQTNLLALNAAIEAARAGEQGRGFAVVADEVRKLAERTGKATGEITEMIKGIQNDSSRAVESMNEAGEQVEQGKTMADKAGNSLTEITTMSSRVMDMIVQIAIATDEQSAAAEQISKNMEQIANVSRETAAGAEQSASSAEELNQQAESLQAIVDKFKLVHS